MINILINAYAVAPNWGSEQGMGWNWITNIAKYCNCHIITEGEWKEEIEKAVAELPQKDNLHFYYNPVSDKIRQICWNQGDWRFYYYYRLWQKKTLKIAEQICKENQIDVIHQLNMVGFREPGLLWKIEGPKYVWGPIGGMENIPTAYLKDANGKLKLFCRLKNFINTFQYTYQPNVKKAIKRSDCLIAAVKGVKDVLKEKHHRDSILINETGTNIDYGCPVRQSGTKKKHFDILWVGRFIYTKQLGLALRVIEAVKDLDVRFHICGTGSDANVAFYKQRASKLGIEDKCIWYGKVEHDKIQQIMANSDLFLFTSIMEATSTVILEAISSGLPILCYDICGFGPLVTDKIGRKIQISNPKQSIKEFALQIRDLYHNREKLDVMSSNELTYRDSLSWESKAEQMYAIYKLLVK